MTHFVRTFSIMRAYGVKLNAIDKAQNYGKIVYMHQKHFWECHQKSQAYFSHLAALVLFFFTKRLSQKGGRGWHNALP